MDTRFPPLPKRVLVPLYPQLGRVELSLLNSPEDKLRKLLCELLGTEQKHILLSSSGSNALASYLAEINGLSKTSIKVALPAFNCLSLVQSIISAGCTPVFIDIDDRLELKSESIRFMKSQKCDYVVWPNYFGARQRDEEVAKKLHDSGIKIICDEAQSFPNRYSDIKDFVDRYADLVLISFGRSKPIAGAGGGALYMPYPDNSFNKISERPQIYKTSRMHIYTKELQSAINQRLMWYKPKITKRVTWHKQMEDRLSYLIQIDQEDLSYEPIGSYESYVAFKNLKMMIRLPIQKKREKYLETIKHIITQGNHGDRFRYLRNVLGCPSILAVEMLSNERYDKSNMLSEMGIQSTWYYYPLNLLELQGKYPTEKTITTNQIASRILIMPFQWRHSRREMKRLISGIKSIF